MSRASPRTSRCFATAWRLIGRRLASSVAVAGRTASQLTSWRRVGSASAAKTSCCMCNHTVAHHQRVVKRAAGSTIDRKSVRGPGDKTADDIGRVLVAKLMQADRGEARGIALMADEDEIILVSGERGALVSRCRIDAPLKDAQRDVQRARDAAVPRPKIAVARIDEDPSGPHRVGGLRRRQPAQPGSRGGEHVIDPALRDARMLSYRRTSC